MFCIEILEGLALCAYTERMVNILAADIGGTNSRFAAFTVPGHTSSGHTSFGHTSSGHTVAGLDTDSLHMGTSHWLETAHASSFADLLSLLADDRPDLSPAGFDLFVAAVPGPVRAGSYAQPANIDWAVDVADVQADVPTLLINDFVAQGWGCLSPTAKGARTIRPGTPQPDGATGVIGAGTGLGHCALVPLADASGGGYAQVPSEQGHAGFAFHGKEEEAYHAFLCKRFKVPYAYGDLVVSGNGLCSLHAYLHGEELSASEVADRLEPGGEVVRRFARYYGRAARHYCLATLATGGMYVAGGVAAKNPALVDNDFFREEFIDSPTYGALLQQVPMWLVDDEANGLYGAARCGVNALARGVLGPAGGSH